MYIKLYYNKSVADTTRVDSNAIEALKQYISKTRKQYE